MYATNYAEVVDVKSLDRKDYKCLKAIPDEVIRDEWKERYALIRVKFPRNYLTANIKNCLKCGLPLGARLMRKHKCQKPAITE